MQFHSTREQHEFVSASQAIAQGLSDEGGLFVPASFPQADWQAWQQMDYPALAAQVLSLYLTDYEPAFLTAAAQAAYGEKFAGGAVHLQPAGDNTWSLELWHGPTCAFKDYALQIMPRLLVEAKHNLGTGEKTFILVATSGDTGKAALEGFRDVDGVQIAAFYPHNGTSEIQRLQMATQEGDNVAAYAVEGNFDDAQTGVKRVFADETIAEELEGQGIRLSSANSINFGRLAPQIAYYFAAYFSLLRQGTIQPGQAVNFCVPTGNFGDILAGYYAKRMGLPVGRLICASNRNNVLTEFFETGRYNARREFYRTTSPSMDILISSNLERLLYHITQSDAAVREYMSALAKTGEYRISPEALAMIRADFACGYADDGMAAQEILAQSKAGYLCDPHTAVAFKVARDYRVASGDAAPMVVLSTASPFKFPRDVLAALGEEAPEDDFAAMDRLQAVTGHAAPESLTALKTKPVRFDAVIGPEEIADVALGTK